MSARAESELQTALYHARARRIELEAAVRAEREATVGFVDEALNSGWSWERIGTALGITGTGARRYYARNRRKVRAGGIQG